MRSRPRLHDTRCNGALEVRGAAGSLEQAATLLPERARVRYNYALALQHLGDLPRAESELLKAHETDPLDPGILNALTTFYLQRRDLTKALRYAEQLAQLAPDTPGPNQMVRHIREQLGRAGSGR